MCVFKVTMSINACKPASNIWTESECGADFLAQKLGAGGSCLHCFMVNPPLYRLRIRSAGLLGEAAVSLIVICFRLHSEILVFDYRLVHFLLNRLTFANASMSTLCQKKSTFLFFKYLCQKLTDFNDFWCVKSWENFTSNFTSTACTFAHLISHNISLSFSLGLSPLTPSIGLLLFRIKSAFSHSLRTSVSSCF